jgi:type I restriction enzyme, S subunit
MAEFKLSDKVNPNKIFILKTSEIEKRLDPFYYIPEIKELEEKVRKKDVKPLRHFVVSVSSGATPKTAEKEKYYSDKENGIPFLRVQNLSPTGILEYEDCKYINKETHEGYLKRSQVKGGDLLVKITGVGRMAVASVAPDGFIGNTNQHMVVIKTGSKEVSTILASYLNSDIGEKLASRRATGGTRPALDYPALLSIPILFDEQILKITTEAVDKKNKKQEEAKELLASIDEYLLGELGITLPKKDNTLENRIFTTSFNKIVNRLEPQFYNTYFTELETAVTNSNYDLETLKNICDLLNGFAFKSNDYTNETNTLNIRMSNIRPNNKFDTEYNPKYLPDSFYELYKTYRLNEGDIIVAMTDMASDPKILGVPTIVTNPHNKNLLLNQRVGKLYKINTTKVDIDYLRYILSASFIKAYYNQQGARGVQINISREQILSAKIPLPPKEKQIEIANVISELRQSANQLEIDADQIMLEAKVEVENIILGI